MQPPHVVLTNGPQTQPVGDTAAAAIAARWGTHWVAGGDGGAAAAAAVVVPRTVPNNTLFGPADFAAIVVAAALAFVAVVVQGTEANRQLLGPADSAAKVIAAAIDFAAAIAVAAVARRCRTLDRSRSHRVSTVGKVRCEPHGAALVMARGLINSMGTCGRCRGREVRSRAHANVRWHVRIVMSALTTGIKQSRITCGRCRGREVGRGFEDTASRK